MNKKQIMVVCLSLVVSSASIAGIRFYEFHRASAEKVDVKKTLGLVHYTEFLTIQSVDNTSNTLIAETFLPNINQNILVKYHLAANIVVERRDVVIEGNIIVGTTTTTPATIADLSPGTRGYGVVFLRGNGEWQLDYFLLGYPLPRP